MLWLSSLETNKEMGSHTQLTEWVSTSHKSTGGAGWEAMCKVSEHKKNHPPPPGSLKKERITIWKIIALQKGGKKAPVAKSREP